MIGFSNEPPLAGRNNEELKAVGCAWLIVGQVSRNNEELKDLNIIDRFIKIFCRNNEELKVIKRHSSALGHVGRNNEELKEESYRQYKYKNQVEITKNWKGNELLTLFVTFCRNNEELKVFLHLCSQAWGIVEITKNWKLIWFPPFLFPILSK